MNIKKNESHEMGFARLVDLFEHTQVTMQTQVARSVDIALVVRNWLFGWYIVEFESCGAERSELYGKKLLQHLSTKLKKSGLKGVSLTSLKQFKLFYDTYKEIGQALPDQSSEVPRQNILQELPDQSSIILSDPIVLQTMTTKLAHRFMLGWTHYITLLAVKNSEERRFYELESVENGWGYRELERQINSALYERLALSRDKNEVKKLSVKGQIIERPADIIKNPYILEFTGLEERKSYICHN